MKLQFLHFCALAFSIVPVCFSKEKLKNLAFLLVIVSPFYTMAIIDIPSLTAYIKPPEIIASLLFIFFVAEKKNVFNFDKSLIIFFVLGLSAFLIPLAVNYFSFTPLNAWEINPNLRNSWSDKLVHKESLSSSNITQLLYVVVGFIVAVIVSTIRLTPQKFISAIKAGLFITCCIGLIQIALYYSNNYEVYMRFFYNNSSTSFQVLADQVSAGFKRINSTLPEASIFGYYLLISYVAIKLLSGEKKFYNLTGSKLILFTVVVGFLSTSGTFYYGILVFFISDFFIGASNKTRKVFLGAIIFILSCVILANFVMFDFIQFFLDEKAASFNERFYFGFLLPFENFIRSPFFGYAFGTSRATVLLTNLLISIGSIGVLLLFLAVKNLENKKVNIFIIYVLVFGIFSPDINYIFIWCYIGALVSISKNKGCENNGVC